MKKGKVFTKSQVALAVMVVALAGAVWLNMKYSSNDVNTTDTSSKYLGQAEYVNGTVSNAVDDLRGQTPAEKYFNSLRSDRLKSRNEAYEMLEETISKTNLSEEEKKTAIDLSAELSARTEKEAAIETLLRAKGFSASLAIIGDKDINIIIKCDEILPAQTVQIQDAVTSQTNFTPAAIKIVAMSDSEIEKALK